MKAVADVAAVRAARSAARQPVASPRSVPVPLGGVAMPQAFSTSTEQLRETSEVLSISRRESSSDLAETSARGSERSLRAQPVLSERTADVQRSHRDLRRAGSSSDAFAMASESSTRARSEDAARTLDRIRQRRSKANASLRRFPQVAPAGGPRGPPELDQRRSDARSDSPPGPAVPPALLTDGFGRRASEHRAPPPAPARAVAPPPMDAVEAYRRLSRPRAPSRAPPARFARPGSTCRVAPSADGSADTLERRSSRRLIRGESSLTEV